MYSLLLHSEAKSHFLTARGVPDSSIVGHVTKTWFLKLWITAFWTQILHLNFKENVEKMMW